MADPMVVEVVTPEQSLLAGAASAVVLRSSDGELTVLPGHTPLITDVLSGLVRVEREEGEVRLAVHGGFLHVDTRPGAAIIGEGPGEEERGDGRGEQRGEGRGGAISTRVTLLAGVAELATEIDVARAETAREAAERRLAELQAGGPGDAGPPGTGGDGGPGRQDVERTEAEAALGRAELRLQVGRGS